MSRMKVVLAPKSISSQLPVIEEMFRGYDVQFVVNETDQPFSREETIELCRDADAILSEVEPLDAEVLSQCIKLKYISKYGTGTDNVDLGYAREHGIEVRRALFANNESVAEMAVALMFVMFRGIYPAVNSVKQGGWERRLGNEILGRTAGVIGMGAIGREVIRMCSGLGMKIVACDPFFDDRKFIERYSVEMEERDDLLCRADVVFTLVPLMPETAGMVNSSFLSKMKSTAYLINTSRGGLVDVDDLYEALKNGVIAGAGADVFTTEPPQEHHPVLDLDNFILAPHTAAYTEEAIDRCVELSVNNLIDMMFRKS